MTNFLLTEEIRAIIERELPREAGDLVRKRLEQVGTLEKQLAKATVLVDALKEEITRLQATAGKYADIETRASAVKAREAAADVERRSLDAEEIALKHAVELNVVRMESVLAQLQHSDHVLDRLFGNRIIRESVQRSVPVRQVEDLPQVYNSETGQYTTPTIDRGDVLTETTESTETEEG